MPYHHYMGSPSSYPPLVAHGDRVVLFDGVCRMCGAWARFLIRFDRAHTFRLATVQSDEGQAILKWFALPTASFDTMVLVEGNRAYTSSTAFIRVVARLPFPWPLAALAWFVPAIVRNWLYDRIALNRYSLFGKYDACALPNPDHETRFLNAGGAPPLVPGPAPSSSHQVLKTWRGTRQER